MPRSQGSSTKPDPGYDTRMGDTGNACVGIDGGPLEVLVRTLELDGITDTDLALLRGAYATLMVEYARVLEVMPLELVSRYERVTDVIAQRRCMELAKWGKP